MKRFRSRFEGVLRVRRQYEQLAKAEVARRNAEWNSADLRLAAELQALEDVRRTTTRQMEAGVCGSFLTAVLAALTTRQQAVERAAGQRQQAELNAVQAQGHYERTRRELETVEQAVHDERTEHRRTQFRVEDHRLQEQGSQSWYQADVNELRSQS